MSLQTKIAALYVHGDTSTRPEDTEPTPMISISAVEAVEAMGLREDSRYFRLQHEGEDRKRQVSLIDEGTIWKLERQFGPIERSFVKAQIILEGDVNLPKLEGQTLNFPSGATLEIALTRVPCYAMDLISPGLRQAMEHGHQGALARVVATGHIAVGDSVTVSEPETVDATVG